MAGTLIGRVLRHRRSLFSNVPPSASSPLLECPSSKSYFAVSRGGSFLKVARPCYKGIKNHSVPSYPLLMIPPEAAKGDEIDKRFHYFLDPTNKNIIKVEKKIPSWHKEVVLPDDSIWVGSSYGWVLFFHPRTAECYLINPFSPKTSTCDIVQLPPIETLPAIASSSICYVKEEEEGSTCKSITKEFTCRNRFKPLSPEKLLTDEKIIKKVVLSTPPLYINPQGHVVHNEDCIVTIIYGLRSEGNLAFCRLGDTSWTAIATEKDNYENVVYSTNDKLFYASFRTLDFDNEHTIEGWNLHKTSSSSSKNPLKPHTIVCKEDIKEEYVYQTVDGYDYDGVEHLADYLSDWNGNLCVVTEFLTGDGNTYGLQVHKWDSRRNRFVRENIDDANMFVGQDQSVSIFSSQRFPQLRKKSVYCTSLLNFDEDDSGIYKFLIKGRSPMWEFYTRIRNTKTYPTWVVPNFL